MYKHIEVTLTQGNINNGHFYLPRDTDLFPAESWGGENASKMGRQVAVFFEGIEERVMTDIDGKKRLMRSARGQIRSFFAFHRLKAGDTIYVRKTDEHLFSVSVDKPISKRTGVSERSNHSEE